MHIPAELEEAVANMTSEDRDRALENMEAHLREGLEYFVSNFPHHPLIHRLAPRLIMDRLNVEPIDRSELQSLVGEVTNAVEAMPHE